MVRIMKGAPDTLVSVEIEDIFRNYYIDVFLRVADASFEIIQFGRSPAYPIFSGGPILP